MSDFKVHLPIFHVTNINITIKTGFFKLLTINITSTGLFNTRRRMIITGTTQGGGGGGKGPWSPLVDRRVNIISRGWSKK